MSTLDLFRLDGRVALVTGAAGGIGYQIATAMAEAGADVAIADINEEGARASAATLAAETGRRVIAIAADVANPASAVAMVDATVARLGRLDICFANAGIAEPNLPIRTPDEYTNELWDRLISVNLSGVYHTDMAAARHMARNGGGSIVNTASIVGLTAEAFWGCDGYAAAKGGVVNLTRQLGARYATAGIRVNAIAPGYVFTGLSEAESETDDPEIRALQEATMARTPMRRYARPDEMRGIAVFLASDASSYCTGFTYPVDGGWLSA